MIYTARINTKFEDVVWAIRRKLVVSEFDDMPQNIGILFDYDCQTCDISVDGTNLESSLVPFYCDEPTFYGDIVAEIERQLSDCTVTDAYNVLTLSGLDELLGLSNFIKI